MKSLAGGLLCIVFVLGVITSPGLHYAQYGLFCSTAGASHAQNSGGCDGKAPAGHDSDNCSICQLAVTPLISAATATAPVAVISIGETISLPAILPSLRQFCNPHFARGPPPA